MENKDKGTGTIADTENKGAKGTEATAKKGLPTVRAKFSNAYIGKLGNYQSGKVYDLPAETYAALKNDCEKAD